jgi:hypothetical protein
MTQESNESAADNSIILAGRVVGFIPPTQGQMEALIRIGRTLERGTDDGRQDFWMKQIDRIGTLLESLIAEGDRDTVDQLYLTGKIDHSGLIRAIMGKISSNAEKSEDKAIAKAKKVAGARVQRK